MWSDIGWVIRDTSLPFRAPKHENATMNAKIEPPIGPNSARPKSSATVLLRLTVVLSKTTRYDTLAVKNRSLNVS
jgi:hypothetical protein